MSENQRGQQDQLGRRLRILSLDQSFTVERVLADSASGRTELVRDEDGSQFVRKYLAADLLPDNPYRFLLNLDSPHFPKIVLLYELDDAHVVVMEYLRGQSLAERTEQQGRLRVGQALDLGDQLLQAVEVIHNLTPPLIHRDIKPSNIVLAPGQAPGSTTVKLIDFGASRLYKSDQPKDTEAFGTRGFAAPEQFGFRQTDERTDLYAVGVSLYYALTGQVLDSAARQGLVAASRAGGRVDRSGGQAGSGSEAVGSEAVGSFGVIGSPRLPDSAVPGSTGLSGTCLALARIILRATEFDPDQRFSSASQFRQDLVVLRAACPADGSPTTAVGGAGSPEAAEYFPLPSQVGRPEVVAAGQPTGPDSLTAANVSTAPGFQTAPDSPATPERANRLDPRRFLWKLPLGLGLALLALGVFAAPLQHPDQLARFGWGDYLLQLIEFWPLGIWCLLAGVLLLNPFGLRDRLAWFRVKTRRRVWTVLAIGLGLWLLVGLIAYSLLPAAMQQTGSSTTSTASAMSVPAALSAVSPAATTSSMIVLPSSSTV